MTRRSFLTFSSLVAFAVAAFALIAPGGLLAGKGVEPSFPLLVWIREVGVMILAAGITTFLARKAPDSPALRAILIAGAVLHLGLLPIELVALSEGVITKTSGVVPNSLLHVLLAFGFIRFARRITVPTPTPA
jgi:hypothetical protein